MNHKESAKYLSLAKIAAIVAGDFLVKHRPAGKKIDSESQWDIKLAADKQAEKKIIAYLKKNSDFAILSEEAGMVKGSDKYTWIIDPLDGTVNYSRSLPICCVSIGLWSGKQPVLGVVYDFNRREIFTGIVGKGAWLNGKKIYVSSVYDQKKAILCTGFPVNSDFATDKLLQFCQTIQSFKKVRLLGSAALSVCYVACARADAYKEDNIMLWDIAGAGAIAIAAGGKLITQPGTKEQAYNTQVTNGKFAL